MMAKLDELIKDMNKKFKTPIITTNPNEDTFLSKYTIKTDIPALTYLFHGGYPAHTLTEVSGALSGGKTSLCMKLLAVAQKQFKEQYQKEYDELSALDKPTKQQKERLAHLIDVGYKKCLWLDSEHSFDFKWAVKNGVDIHDMLFMEPQDESAESLLQAILDLIDSDGIGFVVIDSLATLTSSAALKKTLEDKTYCGISGALTTWTGELLPKLKKHDCTVMCINQERDVLNAQFPTTNTPGGRAFKFGCHIRMSIRKTKAIDQTYAEIPNKDETFYGQICEIQILKNKATKPDRRISRFTITFDGGVDKLNDIFEMCVTFGIISKSGAWYSIDNEEGEPETYNGTSLKFQGKPKFIAFLKENPEFADQLLEKLENKMSED